MKKTIGRWTLLGCMALGISFMGEDCSGTSSAKTARNAQNAAADNEVVKLTNFLDLKNYNKRQAVADDPTTILWCTTSFPNPSSPIFTVPIVGKLTSGNKRPFSTSIVILGEGDYTPEVPGPDKMFGQSAEYRYGFTPADMYVDWTGMEMFCTQEPTIWQREKTEMVMESDLALVQAHNAARTALKAGNPQEADRILRDAINNIKPTTTTTTKGK